MVYLGRGKENQEWRLIWQREDEKFIKRILASIYLFILKAYTLLVSDVMFITNKHLKEIFTVLISSKKIYYCKLCLWLEIKKQ